MKLLIQSDDYGMTPAVACGAIEAIRNGVVRNTGMFTNMPWAAECVEMIRPYMDRIAFGIDLNASTGSSILGHDKVPGLCHEDGTFFTSRENRELDKDAPDHDHVPYDQVYAEFDAQIQKFIELVGRKPDYLHGHAYGTKTTFRASIDLARKYGILYSSQINEAPGMKPAGMGWYKYGGGPEAQLTQDLASYLIEDKGGMLNSEYGFLVSHCGYADAPLFSLSSFNVCRVKDLEALTSDAVKQWIADNNIELITYKDLPFTTEELPSDWKPFF